MRKTILVLALAIVPGSASAAPCVPNLLSAYLALGGSGCTVGGALFSDFTTFAPTGSATPISAAAINVTPLDVAGNPGLRFDLNTTAQAGDVRQALFGYLASAPAFTGSRLSIAGTNVSPDGAVTAVQNTCLGGTFALGQSGCTGSEATLIAFDIGVDADLNALLAFGPVALIGIVNDFVVDGGIEGLAVFGSASNQFTTAAAVPEPATASLLALGAAFGALIRRRHQARPRN
jgi:hypothetical protein